MSELTGYLVQALAMLFVLAAVAGGVVWAARRWVPGAGVSQGRIKVVDSASVGVGVRLMIVEVEGRRLLLAVTSQQVTLLAELTQPSSEQSDG